MKNLAILLNKKWILKKEDPTLYYQLKDEMKTMKKFLQEKFGYQIVLTPQLIKVEKIPGYAEPWMGIQDFHSILEYEIFCHVLMYLEEKEIEQQFVLSDICEYLLMQFGEEKINWTLFTTRKQLIRVLKYCENMKIIRETDGEADNFSKDLNSEVLYENTGISRFFAHHFPIDIMDFKTPDDFSQSVWFDTEEDKGIVRRHRVYRRLLLSPGIYKESDKNDDFGYIRKYRFQIEKDFQNIFQSDLHVHKSSAYVVLDTFKNDGLWFVKNNALDEMIACIFETFQEIILENKELENEILIISEKELFTIVFNKINNIFKCLPKTYRDKGVDSITEEVINKMENYGFIKKDKNIKIYPIVGKISGGFMEENNNGN